jgi:uncharacterized protein (TIGR02145 family)
MAKIKYGQDVNPLKNEHSGFTFQSSAKGNVMMKSQSNDRNRYLRQINRKRNIVLANTHWRNMSPGSQAAWQTFAKTFPQPCQNPASGFLSGYECFIKRQSYLFLNYGVNANFMTAPSLTEISNDLAEWVLVRSGDRLLLYPTFTNNSNDLDISVFLSFKQSAGRIYQNTQTRYMGVIINSQPITPVFGCLYRSNVLTDARNVAPPGYHCPSYDEIVTLVENCGGSSVAGGILKDVSLDYWNSPNSGASNSFGFSCRGIGECRPNFQGFKSSAKIWTITPYNFGTVWELQLRYNSASVSISVTLAGYGQSLRVIKNDSILPSNLVGNDGVVYPVCKIGDQVWQALPSIESKFRTGDLIPLISSDSAWSANTLPARRFPSDNASLAYTGAISMLDVTDLYVSNFGSLPSIREKVLFKAVPCAKSNGQFFPTFMQVLQVT